MEWMWWLIPYATVVLVWLLATIGALQWCKIGKAITKEKNDWEHQQTRKTRTDSQTATPLSVVVTTCNQAKDLEQRLPLILEQEYDGAFEVIVIDIASTDETMSLLERFEKQYPNLRHTFTPPTARDISLRRLALTLGIKAANYDWVILTSADAFPCSSKWLQHIGKACQQETCDMVLGMTRHNDLWGWHEIRWDFLHTWQQMRYLTFAFHHSPCRADIKNIAYRRSFFIEHKGFALHQRLNAGAEELLVNHYGTEQNTQIVLHPDSHVIVDIPIENRKWRQERTFYMETRRHQRHTFLYRTAYAWDITLMHICQLTFLCSLAWSLWKQDYVLLSITLALALLLLTTYDVCFNYSLRKMNHKPIHWRLGLLTSLIPLWDAMAWLTHRYSKKDMFRKKFI